MSRIYYRGAKAAVVCFGEWYNNIYITFVDDTCKYNSLICLLMYILLFFCWCIDLTDQSSFERAKFWVNELKQTEEVSSLGWREATKVYT